MVAGEIGTEAISILCLRSCSVLGFPVHTMFFKSPHRQKSSGVKTGNWGRYSKLLLSVSMFSLCKVWWTLVLQTPVSQEPLPYRLLGDCVQTCNTVSVLPLSVELWGLQRISCPNFAHFHQSWTYHATVTHVRSGGGDQSSFLWCLCISFTFSFSSSI
jgi:hypothetical protein